MLKGLTYVGEV